MRRTSKWARQIRSLGNKRGSQFVEAAITLPVIILAVMLMIRLFTFYMEILDTGICEHIEALRAFDGYRGIGMKAYGHTSNVEMLSGGLLRFDVSKRLDTKLYLINEDLMVRAGELF